MDNDHMKKSLAYKIIEREIRDSHLKWKVSDIAKSLSVSRALIYYHLGKTKREILKSSIAVVCEDYYALSGERSEWLFQGRLADSVIATREILIRHPSLAVFYQKWRFHPSEISDQLSKIEERYQMKLHKAWPQLPVEKIRTIYVQLHGFVTAPFANERDIRAGLADIEHSVKTAAFYNKPSY